MATATVPPKRDHGQAAEAGGDELGSDHPDRRAASGIYTKIDFDNREVAECHSTSSIFRGYSIFMKGKDPRDAHFITSRICGICGDNHATCATYAQNMAFGVQPPAHGRVDRQPRRGRRVHVRPQHLPGQPGRRGLLRADGQGDQPRRLGEGQEDRGAARGRPRLPHHRRHHDGAQSVHRRVLPRDAAREPLHPGDVLPDGRAARASVDAVSRAASAPCRRCSSSPTTSCG